MQSSNAWRDNMNSQLAEVVVDTTAQHCRNHGVAQIMPDPKCVAAKARMDGVDLEALINHPENLNCRQKTDSLVGNGDALFKLDGDYEIFSKLDYTALAKHIRDYREVLRQDASAGHTSGHRRITSTEALAKIGLLIYGAAMETAERAIDDLEVAK